MTEKITLIDRIVSNRTLSHVLFWTVLFGTTTLLAILKLKEFYPNLVTSLVLLPIQIAAAYTLAYYQIPKLLLQKKYFAFSFSTLGSILFFSFLARWAVIYIAEPIYRVDFTQETILEILMDPFYLLIVYFPTVYLFPMILLTVKTIKERFEEKHQLEILKKEKATAELNFLKAQIHPHFLFNTLNNLYSLTLDKSDAAPEVVVKLSEMLDYMLYQCSDPTIPIHKEVNLIQNYIDLELLRYGDKLDLVFNQNIDDSQKQVAPLILLSLVENAFKHGASGNLKNPKVHISLQLDGNKLFFKVFNTKPPIEQQIKSKKGLGSNNIKRQLDLIYPDKHQLIIDDKTDSYQVILEIELN